MNRHNIHCDRRFADKSLDEHAQRDALRSLIQTYLYTFRELNVQTWLMHGSLLGWWWGKKVRTCLVVSAMHQVKDGAKYLTGRIYQIMPWDRDADVQISEADIYFLAAYYNMTTYYYKFPGIPEGRVYLLDINPHFEHRDADDRLNVIDARWIDTQTGLFIDITAARYDVDHPRGAGMLYDKNRHEYRVSPQTLFLTNHSECEKLLLTGPGHVPVSVT